MPLVSRRIDRANVFLWTLYDFANSIVTIVFFLHFSQWLVLDKGVSDFWYNMIFTAGSVLLVFTAPILGSIADKTGRHQRYLNTTTVLMFFFFLSTTFAILFFSDDFVLAIFFYLLANYLYQLSFVFYNSLLHDISPPEKWGRISGLGQTGNLLGQIGGLLIALPFAAGSMYLLGESGRAQTFLPAVLVFFALALPFLTLFKLPRRRTVDNKISLRAEYKNQWQQFKELIKVPSMGPFLLSYFFFMDAIITVSNNFPIYLGSVFGVSDNVKTVLLVGIILTAAIGAFSSGWAADKIGLRKALGIVLVSWVVILPLLGLTSDFTIFVLLSILMGFSFGSIWTITRAVMTALCPKEKLNFGFSFYTLAERVSTFLGPLSWGLITWLFESFGSTRYRFAMMAMAIFVAVGVYFFRTVKIEH